MQGWKKEISSVLPKELELVNRTTFIQRRNITPFERDGTGEGEEKEKGYTCEYRFLNVDEYYAMLQQEENNDRVNENLLVSMGAQAELYEKVLSTEENQVIIMQAIAELYELQMGGD